MIFLAVVISVFCINLSSIGTFAGEAKEVVPTYSGSASAQLNKNVPEFSAAEIVTDSFEEYGKLDKLGRCTPAMACLGKDLMPTKERESIGMVKPTGWDQNKYPGLVDSDPPYLYNRCHMIGFQLTGENANERNLITGTRYMNVEGMLPYENAVATYIKSTGNHVMYRVTPVFEGKNLLCSGVKMEAYSVEDKGKGVSFNVYCFNVQPGVAIDYTDGSNAVENAFVINETVADPTVTREAPAAGPVSSSYIANKNTKKFHYPSCSSVGDMKEKNKLYFEGSRDELIDQGYVPCKRCNP
ncbi:MAG: DNA/RNA non-specific endonuclease [Butyrivibrio sp.]|nr:DNA/RNA non-specific endonuclease [Butyrivibrio sp.]